MVATQARNVIPEQDFAYLREERRHSEFLAAGGLELLPLEASHRQAALI